ncbi:MAG: glycosyltransferase family 39 protein [Candidatus Omnitrophica bacterium]|nr:glycosyltransferase family 39 protein [Candidatus Omnitrophota bacterium]
MKLSKKQTIFIIAFAVIFISLYVYFYPPMYTVMDEASYFDFAYNLKSGKIIYENPAQAHFILKMVKGYVNQYPIGMPLLLLPFTFIGWKSLFLLNPLLHILAYMFFYKLLKKYNISPYLALLYLFYPGFLIYARTLMPDMACASFITIAFYFYLKNSKKSLFIAGILLGYLCLIKYTNVIIAGILLAASLYFSIKDKNLKVLNLLYGMAPFFIFIAWYNYNYYGAITASPYFSAGMKFAMAHIGKNITIYLMSLLFIYPFMLITLFLPGKNNPGKTSAALTAPVFLVLISLHYFHQGVGIVHCPGVKNAIQYLIMSQRLILPIIPFFLLCYTVAISGLLKRKSFKIFVFILIAAVFTGSIYTSHVHQEYLSENNEVRVALVNNTADKSYIICDNEANKFIQKAWGARQYIDIFSARAAEYAKTQDRYIFIFERKDKPENAALATKRAEKILRALPHKLIYEKSGFLSVKIYKIV